MDRKLLYFLVLMSNVLIPIGCGIFMSGFFRGVEKDPVITGEGQLQLQHRDLSSQAPFDKVVFMLVDALRSDFVYANNSGFTFTQELIRKGDALPLTALAAPPTLTLSRIKALTQGTSQSFLDSLLNILHSDDARQLKGEDTWVSRMKAETNTSQKMVLYGCDMWSMLYPEVWDRFEIVDSIYLPDHTNGDINITRNLEQELTRDDWKALVLHYVGLDDLAHFGGAHGTYMVSKQAEMDRSVRRIFEAFQVRTSLKNALLVLLGDHGMTERGNHGGDSQSEMSAAMTFISPKLHSMFPKLKSPLPETDNYEYYEVVNQIDVVPTLAGLLGFSIPTNSVGVFIPTLLKAFSDSTYRKQIQIENARQIGKVFETKYNIEDIEVSPCDNECHGCQSVEGQVRCLWSKVNLALKDNNNLEILDDEKSMEHVNTFARRAQQLLSRPINNLSYPRLFCGILCLVASIIILRIAYTGANAPLDIGSSAVELVTILHASSMFMSQLVREEHYFWYTTSLCWWAYLGLRRQRNAHKMFSSFYPLILQFISHCFNPAGDFPHGTMAFVHDILFDYPLSLWALGSVTYVTAARNMCVYLGLSSSASLMVALAFCSLGLIYKLCSTASVNPELLNFAPLWFEQMVAETDRNYLLRVLWAGLALCCIYLTFNFHILRRISQSTILMGTVELCNLYLRSQTRPKNLALYQIFDIQLRWLLAISTDISPSEIALTTLVMGQSSFFAGGRDNQLASLDMMNGYNGLYETTDGITYAVVTIQTLISNWLGPIWWSLASMRLLLSWNESNMAPKHEKAIGGVTKVGEQNKANEQLVKSNKQKTIGSWKQDSNQNSASLDMQKRKHNNLPAKARNDRSKTVPSLRRPFLENLILQSMFSTVSSLAVMLACIWLREEPSLWTVLAPKFVNTGIWVAFHQMMINLVICGVIWTINGGYSIG